ncbi:MAG: Fic family protein [bacterium]
MSTRAGQFITQMEDYKAFIPAKVPPDNPPVEIDPEMQTLLSEADRSLGKLDGITRVLPNPDFFVLMYMRHEAVLSSQIEGTQSSLENVLEYEAGRPEESEEKKRDVQEVINYIEALRYGLDRIKELPLSLRLIREIHEVLMQGVRGKKKEPGQFRESQNWVGSSQLNIEDAEYVPPPPQKMKEALYNLEEFIRADEDKLKLPPLIQCGIAHAQFETIHPFLDGNGRMGRLLIVFILCHKNIIQEPILYISHYMNANKLEYYERLQKIRKEGDWEGWLKFFLKGVSKVSDAATETTEAIHQLRKRDKKQVAKHIQSQYISPLHDYLFKNPVLTINMARDYLNCSYPTAQNLITQLVDMGLLEEVGERKRNRLYRYNKYMELFNRLSIE